MAHTRCMLDKQCYTHELVFMRQRAWENTQTHAGTRARARTPIHKYVTLTAFPQQKWLRERATILRYTYIASLVQIYRYKFSSLYEAGVWNVTLICENWSCS